MSKNTIMQRLGLGAAALALGFTIALTGCGGGGGQAAPAPAPADEGSAVEQAADQAASDFDAAGFFAGKWRAYVETTGDTVYGAAGGTENMVDLDIAADGTFTTTPLENHEDLLATSGTWEGTETGLTLTCEDGTVIEITVVDDLTLEGNPADFGIDGFDTLIFTLY